MASSHKSKSRKRNISLILAGIVVILLIWLLPERGGSDLVKLSAVEGKVDRMIFTRYNETFTIELNGGEWEVRGKGYPVDKDKAKKIAGFISEERDAEIVSEVNVYQPYGLDEENRLQIAFYSKDELIKTLTVGKSANRFGTFYGMVDDTPTVYQITFDRYDLDQEQKDILNLKLFDFSPPKIAEIKLSDRGGESWILTRKEKKEDTTNQSPSEKIWEDEQGRVYSKENVNDIINTLSTLEGENIADILPDTASSPLRSIELKSESGETYFLDIIVKVDDGFWVQHPDKQFYYRIFNTITDRLLVKPEVSSSN